MKDTVRAIAEWSAAGIEFVGIAVIVGVMLFTIARSGKQLLDGASKASVYSATRRRLACGILLGLEFLVAADIIHTVAIELTLRSVVVLAIVVLIRTLLSFTLELESTGRWPWQKSSARDKHEAGNNEAAIPSTADTP